MVTTINIHKNDICSQALNTIPERNSVSLSTCHNVHTLNSAEETKSVYFRNCFRPPTTHMKIMKNYLKIMPGNHIVQTQAKIAQASVLMRTFVC